MTGIKYNIALIGLGNIGLLFDYNRTEKSALSHAKAIFLNDNFNLKYVIDKDDKKFIKIREMFPQVNFFKDWDNIINKKDIDVLIIALPTDYHFKCLSSFINNNNIKVFLIEKPLFL